MIFYCSRRLLKGGYLYFQYHIIYSQILYCLAGVPSLEYILRGYYFKYHIVLLIECCIFYISFVFLNMSIFILVVATYIYVITLPYLR